MQRAGFCCNEFTILIEPQVAAGTGFLNPIVRLKRVRFQDFMWLDAAINDLSRTRPDSTGVGGPGEAAPSIEDILKVASEEGESMLRGINLKGRFHLCSLAIQVLSLGLRLYSQAYAGQIHASFLKRPLTSVSLHGFMVSGYDPPPVVVEKRRLACLEDMVGGDVFVFRQRSHPHLRTRQANTERLYVHGSCAQLADLWGPGYTMSTMEPSSPSYAASIVGFYIRGGIIQPRLSLSGGQVFHWAPIKDKQPLPNQTFSYWDDITIGGLTECQPVMTGQQQQQPQETNLTGANVPASTRAVAPGFQTSPNHRPPLRTNTTCPLNLADSRRESEPYLCMLGTSSEWWLLTEVQGMAAMNAPYFTLQGSFAMTKQCGVPLKRVLLDRWMCDENLSLFDEPWGLQVSLCTGVARRVPIRNLVDESLIRFIDSLEIPGWKELRPRAQSAFNAVCPGFSKWVAMLNSEQKQCMRTVCKNALHILKDTGFDSSGRLFSILWPYDNNASFCVKIHPEKDKDQLWCSMLQESEWSASFAVVSDQCLETQEHTCRRGAVSPWRGGAVLSTVVCPNLAGGIPRSPRGSPSGPSTVLVRGMQGWELQHDKQYWVGKQGGQVWVVVRKGPGEVTELQVKRNRFPSRIGKKLWPDRILREKPDVSFCGEDVFVMNH